MKIGDTIRLPLPQSLDLPRFGDLTLPVEDTLTVTVMSQELSIHNGVVIGDSPVQTEQVPDRAPAADLDPNEISRAMAQVVSEGLHRVPSATPMELVNLLLQLKTKSGKKLVFTRFDLFQCFALWSKKMTGESRL